MSVQADKVVDYLVNRVAQQEKNIAILMAENQELKEKLKEEGEEE